jgi:hypothetical protein
VVGPCLRVEPGCRFAHPGYACSAAANDALLLTLEDALNVTDRKPELVETGMPWRADVVNDPARDQRRVGSLVRWSAAPLLLHDDRRADLDPVIEIDHVLIGHANAAR